MKDLFCGRGGATKGFMAEGWTCVGYDLYRQPDYPAEFHQTDVLAMTADDLRRADFVWASSPCEEFSVHCMKHFHPNPKHPEMGIRLFEHTRNICEQAGVDYVMENVRCAEKFVGRAVNHCGPFYLWGNAVPAVFPREVMELTKTKWRPNAEHGRIGKPGNFAPELLLSRKERAARLAQIPVALSQYIAQCATRNLPTQNQAKAGAEEAAMTVEEAQRKLQRRIKKFQREHPTGGNPPYAIPTKVQEKVWLCEIETGHKVRRNGFCRCTHVMRA